MGNEPNSDADADADANAGGSAIADAEVRVTLKLGDETITASVRVPAAPVALGELTPVFRGFAEMVIDRAVKAEESRGRRVSCAAGCGACCRQLVPISEFEARHIRDMVDAFPEARREEIRRRFAAGRQRLAESGVLEKLVHPERFTNEELGPATLGLEYFRLRIACPFLEDESCSIHPERPIACREYLVTSPPEHCSAPEQERVEGVVLNRKVSAVINQLGTDKSRRFARCRSWALPTRCTRRSRPSPSATAPTR